MMKKVNKGSFFATSNVIKIMAVNISNKPPDPSLGKTDLTNFIKIYFDFTFCLLMSPFRFIKGDNNKYYPKTWKPQQLLCAIVHTMVIFRLVGEIRNTIPESRAKMANNPGPYFNILMTTSSAIYKLTTMKRFWRHRNAYQTTLNGIAGNPYLSIHNRRFTKVYMSYFLYGQAVLQIICCLIAGKGFVTPIWTWSPSMWLRRIIGLGRFTYCFGDKLRPDQALEFADMTFWDYALAVLMTFTMTSRYIFGYFCDLGILSHALTLWTAANSLAKTVHANLKELENLDRLSKDVNLILQRPRHTEQKWPIIYSKFKAVQNLSLDINNALGSKVTYFLAEALLYYSINMNAALLTKDFFQRIYLILFYLSTFTTVFLAADVCNQLESIKLWLIKDDNAKNVPAEESALVLHEMVVKDIGIRGSNVFTLNYGVIATFLSLVFTFFVVCVQQTGVYQD